MTPQKLGKIQRNILEIVKEYPEAADNDMILIGLYWQRFDNWNERRSLLENVMYVTRPSSIERRRRELHNLGLIKYSEQRENEIIEAMKNEKFGINHNELALDCE